MAALAPSSPRLPSPPPPAEIQIGPKSPSMDPSASLEEQEMEHVLRANSKRRIHPGTKAADFAAGPPLVPLHELDSAFQLQEHLAALHYHHTTNNTVPITRETAALLASPPPGTDRTLWLYELCRFLIAQCNSLIVGFLFDTPPCSAATCPEMRASEWQFLCAVHETPKSCCAIDYCCHTLDWAANVVTNPKIFPSRFVLADAAGHDKGAAVKNLVNVFRRLHRIFAHAWFQHRGVFWSVEGQTGLYVFFKTVCDLYELLPAENYKLPPEAEGLEAPTPMDPTPTDRKPGTGRSDVRIQQHAQQSLPQDEEQLQPVRTNTSRHLKRPSTGRAVATVLERDEDEGAAAAAADVTSRMRHMHISAPPDTVEEEGDEEMAELTVIVEHGVMHEEPEHSSSSTESRGEAPPEPSVHEAPAEQSGVGSEDNQDAPNTTEEAAQPISNPEPEPPAQGKSTAIEEPEESQDADGDETLLAVEPEQDAEEPSKPTPADVSTHDFAVEHKEKETAADVREEAATADEEKATEDEADKSSKDEAKTDKEAAD